MKYITKHAKKHEPPIMGPCPYCERQPEYVDSAVVYGRSFGMIYLCRQCQAWVGVHPGTNKPLGTLANAELRKARQAAHRAFDPLWKETKEKRGKAYARLAIAMNMPRKLCHIAMMSVSQCGKVILVSKSLGVRK